MFNELKEKVNNYFDEHPKVKKGLQIGGGILIAAGAGYGCYKLGVKVEGKRISDQNFKEKGEKILQAINESIVDEPEKPTFPLRKDIPLVEDKHTFDMMFRDVTTGTKYTAKESCYGYYVNDILQSFSDTPIEIITEEGLNETTHV